MRFVKRVIVFFLWVISGVFVFSVLFLLIGLVAAMRHSGKGEDVSLGAIKTEHAVALVELKGEILSSDSFRKSLNKAVDEEQIKAIVVRIDSPGGSVGAAQEIHRLIKDADAQKPVICSLGNTAASGGIYAAVGCRKIVANPGTLTGSIGVIFMMPNFESIMGQLGLQMNVIKSGRFKDTGTPFRQMDTEDRALLQGIVEQSYEQFLRTVADGRKLDINSVRGFADGRIILGEEALKNGLVDELGGVDRAAKLALEQTGDMEKPELIPVKKPSGFSAFLSAIEESETAKWFNALGHARLLYQSYF